MASLGYVPVYYAIETGKLIPQATAFFLMKAVPDILSESPSTPNHRARREWAEGVERSKSMREIQAQRLAVYLVQNPTIAAAVAADQAVDDQDVEYVGLQRLEALIAQNASG